jgi:hypothetical protein
MKLLILATLLFMCSLAGASADPIYYDGSINESSEQIPFANWPKTFTVPKFDPSLGRLDAIVFEIWGGFWTRMSWTGALDGNQPVIYNDSVTFMASVEEGNFAYLWTINNEICNASLKSLSVVDSGSSTTTYYRPDDQQYLDWFTGTGNKVVTVTPTEDPVWEAWTTLTNVTFQTTLYIDYWSVEYDYTPVPEPSSLTALAAFAGTGLMMMMRRRRW